MYEHKLTGCRTTPLAGYLKALGVLRLVSEQVDNKAAGYWQDDVFVLKTKLTKDELLDFFVDDYAPTPLIAPWNNGSGFYSNDNKKGVEGIEGSELKRFAIYKQVIKRIKSSMEMLKETEDDKEEVQASVRSQLPAESLAWIDSAIITKAEGKAKLNPVLGTGGNEGRLDFTNNFMQRIVDLLIIMQEDKRLNLLKSCFFDDPVSSLEKAPIGQFDPGVAGGFNQGVGIETKGFKINHWDFILMLEGACIMTSSISRRNETGIGGWATIPFTVHCSGVGFSSSSNDEGGRAESWLPIWSKPTRLKELQYIFSEGRNSLGKRNSKTGLDFARSVSTLGSDRGIEGFSRYTFLERRGQSYLALPAGKLPVKYNPKVRLLDDLDPLLSKLDFFLRQFSSVPAAFASVRRKIDEAMFACATMPSSSNFIRLVSFLGRMEYLLGMRDKSKPPKLNNPLGGLSASWILECDNNTPEIRIAAALASIGSTGKVGSIRANMAGVDPAHPWKWASGKAQQCWIGNSFIGRLVSVIKQRMMDTARLNSTDAPPFYSKLKISAHDLVPFLLGETDDNLIEDLLWGFSLINWKDKKIVEAIAEINTKWEKPLSYAVIPRPWIFLKLLFSPQKIRGIQAKADPRILNLLASGRTAEALQAAHRRLLIDGLKPLPIADYNDIGWVNPKRLLAGLLVPVTDMYKLERLVLLPKNDDK